MEIKAPKRKRTNVELQFPLPGMCVHPFTNEVTLSETFIGVFNGFGVTIKNVNAVDNLYNNGFFGKGSLSRSLPLEINKNKNVPKILKQRQYISRETLLSNTNISFGDRNLDKFIVLPDSDNEDIETDIEVLKSTYSDLPSYIKQTESYRESYFLSLEEAFFLTFGVGCLKIQNELGELLTTEQIWKLFLNTQPDFVHKYIVYHYFRSKEWVVKSGLKYGSDFRKYYYNWKHFIITGACANYNFLSKLFLIFIVLYKDGPIFYHASYAVKIQVIQSHDVENKYGKELNKYQINAITRLANASGKVIYKSLTICFITFKL